MLDLQVFFRKYLEHSLSPSDRQVVNACQIINGGKHLQTDTMLTRFHLFEFLFWLNCFEIIKL